jgi:putative alpha-1,2-mannosidase
MEALGVRVYVSIVFPEQGTCSLFQGRADAGGRCLSFEGADACESAGVVWRGAESGTVCEVRLGFSLKDCDDAARNVDAVRELSFAGMAGVAARVWGEVLGRIRVEGGSDTERSLFYSNLYHSLIKPMDCGNTSPLRAADRVFVTDFATLWDQYKTHLPLILTFYPETGTRIVNSLLNAAEVAGEFSNALFLNRDPVHFGDQARGLSHLVLADAFLRRLPGIDWHRALDLLVRDLTKPGNADFLDTGIARPFTHTLDLAQACFAVSWIADGLGQGEVCDRFRALARQWRNVYDLNTGILSGESEYYEGGAWNYSFRLLHDMAGRIALHGGDAAFVRDLERFFGYGEEPVPRPSDPRDGAAFDAGLALGRFEGFNNEPDMEAPYAFHYAGRPDRAAEVVRAGLRYQFASGRGGLPGNNDSGGLSSLYVWNSLGLFPVTGQPVILLGSPVFPRARLQLPGAELEIRAPETSESCIHVSGVRRNGCELERAYLTLDEFLAGGLLEFSMAECPGGWGAVQRPPSWA